MPPVAAAKRVNIADASYRTCEGYADHHRRLVVTGTCLQAAGRLAVLLHEAAHAVLRSHLVASSINYIAG